MEDDSHAGPPEQHFSNAIRAVQNKKPAPEIDFTIHQMEDGTEVNTQERVCKGEWDHVLPCCPRACHPR